MLRKTFVDTVTRSVNRGMLQISYGCLQCGVLAAPVPSYACRLLLANLVTYLVILMSMAD